MTHFVRCDAVCWMQCSRDLSRKNLGLESSRKNLGLEPSRKNLGLESSRNNLGLESSRNNFGLKSSRIFWGLESSRNNLGLESSRKNLGFESFAQRSTVFSTLKDNKKQVALQRFSEVLWEKSIESFQICVSESWRAMMTSISTVLSTPVEMYPRLQHFYPIRFHTWCILLIQPVRILRHECWKTEKEEVFRYFVCMAFWYSSYRLSFVSEQDSHSHLT